jgi:hypothetical protein
MRAVTSAPSAVLNCGLHLAGAGDLVQVRDVPNAFSFPNASTPADEDDITHP